MTRTKRFNVNGYIFTVRERYDYGRNSDYTCTVGKFKETGYSTSPDSHKYVLLAFLGDAGRAGAIDHATANWSEGAITEITRQRKANAK